MALRQARELLRHGRVTLVSDSLPEEGGGAAGVLVRVRDLHWLRRFRHAPDEILFARAARKALRALPAVDFVLCHSHALAYLAARPLGVPFGLLVHGDISDRPAGTYDPRLTAFYRWVTPRSYRAADVVFVLAPFFVALAQRGGARKIEILPNGIDPAAIGGLPDRISHARKDGEPLRILFVGRLSVEKGLTYLLDACAMLDAQVPYELTIVGGGPLEAEVRARLTARTRFTGVVPRAHLGAVYGDHDVFCTPALSEPFATVILEALVSGLPVIGTRVGGIPDVVEEGRNGLLVPPADAPALAGAISRLALDEPLRASMAGRARASVLPRLAWDSIGDRLAEAIRRVIAR